MVVYVAENGLAWSRLGLSVSKRVGNAVCRHRIRRRIREAFRLSKAELPVGWDIVCVAKPASAEPKCDLMRSLRQLIVLAIRKNQRAQTSGGSAAQDSRA